MNYFACFVSSNLINFVVKLTIYRMYFNSECFLGFYVPGAVALFPSGYLEEKTTQIHILLITLIVVLVTSAYRYVWKKNVYVSKGISNTINADCLNL